MSLEQQVTALVEASNNLTSAVNGKIQEIDQKTAENTAKVDSELAKIQTKLPRIIITRNQTLEFESGFPKNFAINSNVTVTEHMFIDQNNVKSPEAVALLQEVMGDTGCDLKPNAHYRKGFRVIKISWSNSPSWLAYPHAADDPNALSIPRNTFLTLGSFTKLLSGSLSSAQAWATGATLGKWVFCNRKLSPAGFGSYEYLHPIPSSASGEMLVMLPAAITGHIDDGSQWFPNVSL